MRTLKSMQFYKVSKSLQQQVQSTNYLNKNEMHIKIH